MMRLTSTIRSHPWAALLVLVYVVLGVAFSVVNPIHEATDELRHYRYVRYIADYGRLPVQSSEEGNAQAHHPPLYYATAALVSFWAHPSDPLYDPPGNPHWSFRNWEVGTDNKNLYLHGPDEAWPYCDASLAAHLARWVTVLWGAATVALTVAIARLLLPSRPAASLAAGALVALNPMFLYLGGAVNNDVPAGLAGAAITYACLRIIRDGLAPRRVVWLGVLYGLAMLVKFNLVAMLAVIELALLLALLPAAGGHSPRRGVHILRANAIILGIGLALSGWWYVRNTILYGEPTGFLRLTEIWGFRSPEAGVRLAGTELGYAWTSLWARFGYGQIPVPQIFYSISLALCIAGLIGLTAFLVLPTIRRPQPDNSGKPGAAAISRMQWSMLAILATAVLVNFAVLYAYITVSPAGAMGRFFFPGLPAFATLVGVGLVAALPPLAQRLAAELIGVGMLIYALAVLIAYLAPAYAIPAQAALPPDPLNIPVGDSARILAYRVEPAATQPGGEVDVTVTWQVIHPTQQPYTVFVHLLSPDGVLIAQRDTYTGLGNYPSHWWRPGHVFTETYRVFLPETAYSPDLAGVEIGLYNPDLGRLPIDAPASIDDALVVGEVSIEAASNAEVPNPVFVNWDNHFALVGYTIEPRLVRPGKKTIVTLYWQALDPPHDVSYKVFLHAVEGWELRWAGADGNPVEHDALTTDWVPGQVYVDRRKLFMPDDIPPGMYSLELGWYTESTGERLNIIAPDGHIIDNWLQLNWIRVSAAE